VLEETGLCVKRATMFEIFERVMRDASGRVEYHYILVDYVCTVVGKTPPRAGDDVGRVDWVGRARLGDYRLTEGTLGVIERAFDARRRRS
jgi:8-oxo-dGTP diphosphatase